MKRHLIVLAVAGALLAGCASPPPQYAASTAADLQKRVLAVTEAAATGDTVAALNHAGVAHNFSFVSTAGGAFLEWMEGRTLPGVAALQS